MRSDTMNLTKARLCEGSRPWSAGAGPGALLRRTDGGRALPGQTGASRQGKKHRRDIGRLLDKCAFRAVGGRRICAALGAVVRHKVSPSRLTTRRQIPYVGAPAFGGIMAYLGCSIHSIRSIINDSVKFGGLATTKRQLDKPIIMQFYLLL